MHGVPCETIVYLYYPTLFKISGHLVKKKQWNLCILIGCILAHRVLRPLILQNGKSWFSLMTVSYSTWTQKQLTEVYEWNSENGVIIKVRCKSESRLRFQPSGFRTRPQYSPPVIGWVSVGIWIRRIIRLPFSWLLLQLLISAWLDISCMNCSWLWFWFRFLCKWKTALSYLNNVFD